MKIFILSRNRPLYLWTCLDSLFRLTRTPCEFIIIDSASDDPLVRPVIEGFERRGLFSEIIWLKRNEAAAVFSVILERLTGEDELFGFIESDAALVAGDYGCWVGEMRRLMEADPKLAMLGSFVDPVDLVSMEAARALEPQLTEDELLLLTHNKYYDPSIYDHYDLTQPVISPHTPAGRLLMLRRGPALQAGAASDSDLHDRLLALGYRTGISTAVRHRHLTLCNIYDYPSYDTSRRGRFMYGYTYRAQMEQRIAAQAVRLVDDPDLHVLVGDLRIDGVGGDDGVWRFDIPAGVEPAWLISRMGFALDSADLRPLGVALGFLMADGVDRLRDAELANGWYGPEEEWRWMGGRAELPRCSVLVVKIVGTMKYVVDRNGLAG
jgi:hypothetical protein